MRIHDNLEMINNQPVAIKKRSPERQIAPSMKQENDSVNVSALAKLANNLTESISKDEIRTNKVAKFKVWAHKQDVVISDTQIDAIIGRMN